MSAPAGRTLTLGDTTLLVSSIRAWRVDDYGPNDDECHTTIWLTDTTHPYSVRGDHRDALAAAVEGWRP